MKNFSFLELKDKEFRINNLNSVEINRDLIIPDGYSLSIQNSTLKLYKGNRIILRGAPIEINNSTLTAKDKKDGWIRIGSSSF